ITGGGERPAHQGGAAGDHAGPGPFQHPVRAPRPLADQRHPRGSGGISRARGGRPERAHRPGDRSHRAVADHRGGVRPPPQHAAGGVPVTPRRWLTLVPLLIVAVAMACWAVPGSAAVRSPAVRSAAVQPPVVHGLASARSRYSVMTEWLSQAVPIVAKLTI